MMDANLAGREASAKQPVWVADDQLLEQLCTRWLEQSWIALDTEFQRVDTFYPRPGLIQVADANACYLIDPLAIQNFAPLVRLLTEPSVVKLLHACSEDLELFEHMLGVVPRPLFDTQMAAAFLGQGMSVGYQRMVGDQLGVELDKGETRSDWLQRPLTDAQVGYAAQDVVYLPTLYARQRAQLEAAGKLDWLMEECGRLVDEVGDNDPQGRFYYRRFSQAWKLRPPELAILQALCAWREQQARARDVPRNHVLRNASILSMVSLKPRALRDLSQVSEMRGRTISRDGRTLLQLVRDAVATPLQDCPEPMPRPLSTYWSQQLKALKAEVRKKAEEVEVAPEILGRKKDLEALVRNAKGQRTPLLPVALQGWRKAVIGERLESLLCDSRGRSGGKSA